MPSSLDLTGVCLGPMHVYVCHCFHGLFCPLCRTYLPVLLDASFATIAIAETVISHLISLDVAGMM